MAILASVLAFVLVPGLENNRRINRMYQLGALITYYPKPPTSAAPTSTLTPAWLFNLFGQHFFDRPTGIILVDCADVPEACNLMSQMSGLYRINITRSQITGADLRKLARLREVDALHLIKDRLDEKSAAAISEITSLKVLQLADCDLTDDSLKQFPFLPNLDLLSISGNPRLTDDGLRYLKATKSITCLALGETHVNLNDMYNWGGLSNIQMLDLENTKLNDRGVANVARLKALWSLNLNNTSISDAALAIIGTMTNLQELSLRNCAISSNGVNSLSRLTNLRTLDIRGTQIDDAAISSIANCQSLESLDLDDTHISDNALTALLKLPALYELSIRNTGVTDRGLQILDGAHSLMSVHAFGSGITATGVANSSANNSDRQVDFGKK